MVEVVEVRVVPEWSVDVEGTIYLDKGWMGFARRLSRCTERAGERGLILEASLSEAKPELEFSESRFLWMLRGGTLLMWRGGTGGRLPKVATEAASELACVEEVLFEPLLLCLIGVAVIR